MQKQCRVFGILRYIHSFIHSGHFYSAPSSPLPLRGAPDHSTDTVSEFHAEAHRQLQVKDLPIARSLRDGQSGSRTHDPAVESNRLNQCATTSHILVSQSMVIMPMRCDFTAQRLQQIRKKEACL